jgi:hypothetical protein
MRIAALPAAAFTASVLFDVLSLVAENAEQSHSYQRRAADLLRLGVGSSLASLGLEMNDYLRAPAGVEASGATSKFAVSGAVATIYLLDLAARQKRASEVALDARTADPLAIGLSLLGLAILGWSTKVGAS